MCVVRPLMRVVASVKENLPRLQDPHMYDSWKSVNHQQDFFNRSLSLRTWPSLPIPLAHSPLPPPFPQTLLTQTFVEEGYQQFYIHSFQAERCWLKSCLLAKYLCQSTRIVVEEGSILVRNMARITLSVNLILTTVWFCHTRLHLGFSAKLKIWQVPTCKMEPRSGIISCNNGPPIHPSTHPPTHPPAG